MQELLAREAAGHDGPVKISSQRTLFGIKSHVEEVIERVAAEDEQRCFDVLAESNESSSCASISSATPTSSPDSSSASSPSSNLTLPPERKSDPDQKPTTSSKQNASQKEGPS